MAGQQGWTVVSMKNDWTHPVCTDLVGWPVTTSDDCAGFRPRRSRWARIVHYPEEAPAHPVTRGRVQDRAHAR